MPSDELAGSSELLAYAIGGFTAHAISYLDDP